MNSKNNHSKTPTIGLAGFTENLKSDSMSGFLVFLLALPLSLGIAKASEFPPIYGLLTAMIGGLIVAFIAGSQLTIKGPAAGLIVIVAGAVTELGHGDAELGWHLTLGVIVVAGLLQVIFGWLLLGKLADFFPLSAVHGMLAAIGIIIISKQLHLVLGVNPVNEFGKPIVEPLDLLVKLPYSIALLGDHLKTILVGIVSLVIVFGWPALQFKWAKKIPSAMVVLIVAIPLSMMLGIQNTATEKPLVSFDKGLADILAVNVSFDGIQQLGVFIKYVIMFALVGSLEALLTVKAIDGMDPYNRKSNYNKDLSAVGFGNVIAGIFGGLPMISEVARSSANVSNGGKTRWANFFHGLFILFFLLFAVSFSELIPLSALAAMLIGVGWKLAHPKEFFHTAAIGRDQLAIFITTIVFTLATDLLIGIGAGILLKMIMHLTRGAKFRQLFKSDVHIEGYTLNFKGALIFSNFMKVKRKIAEFPTDVTVRVVVENCVLIDHSVFDNLNDIKRERELNGGGLEIIGVEHLTPINGTKHKLATHVKKAMS